MQNKKCWRTCCRNVSQMCHLSVLFLNKSNKKFSAQKILHSPTMRTKRARLPAGPAMQRAPTCVFDSDLNMIPAMKAMKKAAGATGLTASAAFTKVAETTELKKKRASGARTTQQKDEQARVQTEKRKTEKTLRLRNTTT